MLNFADQINRLLGGEVDVVLLRPPVPPGIQIQHLASEPRIACVPMGDRLADRRRVRLAELADHVVVDVPPEVPRVWWDFWAVDPRPGGTPVRYGPVVSDLEGLLNTVAGGSAMAFLPAAARVFFPRPEISYVDVADLSPCTSALAWTEEARNRPAVEAIRQAAATVLSRQASEQAPAPPATGGSAAAWTPA